MKTKQTKWKTISDSKVRHVWACDIEDCDYQGKELMVDPSFYQKFGTPICDSCDNDMSYIRTEVQV